MKVYLDDERTPPDGWTLVRWPDEVIDLLKTGRVTHLSLDHDLGDDERGTGYDVLLWLEEQIWDIKQGDPDLIEIPGLLDLRVIRVHSANSGARPRMEAAISSIKRWQADLRAVRKNPPPSRRGSQ